jgi:LCP family protein required for cell wall assembly
MSDQKKDENSDLQDSNNSHLESVTEHDFVKVYKDENNQDVVISEHEETNIKPKKRFGIGKVVSLFLILSSLFFLGAGAYFGYNVFTTADQVIVQNDECKGVFNFSCLNLPNPLSNNDRTKLKGEDEGRTNLLIIGLDEAAGLSDTIILVSYFYNEKKVVTLNIPRDTYAIGYFPNARGQEVSNTGKINEIYPIAQQVRPDDESAGANALTNTISKEFDIPIHYWAVTNFQAVGQVVDELGGIEVNVEETFTDVFPKIEVPRGTPCARTVFVEGGSYCEFTFEAGVNNLNGSMALIFARARKYSSDFDRSKRQSQVIQAVAKKGKEKGIFGNINNIRAYLQILGTNVKTNVQLDEMLSFYKLTEDVDVDSSFFRITWSTDQKIWCSGSLELGRGSHSIYCDGPNSYVGSRNNSRFRERARSTIKNMLVEAQSEELYQSQVAVLGNQSNDTTIAQNTLFNLGFGSILFNNAYRPITAATRTSKEKITVYISDDKLRDAFSKQTFPETFKYTLESQLPEDKVLPNNMKNAKVVVWVDSI